MKIKFLIFKFFFLLTIVNGGFTQGSSLTVFFEEAEDFILFLNGEERNMSPASKVIVEGVFCNECHVKIAFRNASIPSISSYIFLSSGEMANFSVKKIRGEYVLLAVMDEGNTVDIDEVSVTSLSNSEGTSPGGATNNSEYEQEVRSGPKTKHLNTGTVQGSGGSINVHPSASATANENSKASTPAMDNVQDVLGCKMSPAEYQNALTEVKVRPLGYLRMLTAKRVLENRCLTVEQIEGIAATFDYDHDKFDFIIYAYDFAADRKNYQTLSSVFEDGEIIRKLDEFLNLKH